MPATLEPLSIDRVDDIVDVFCDAFHHYPVMRFVVGPEPQGMEARLRALIGYFVSRRVAHRAPMFGMFVDGALVAAATMTRPGEGEMPPAVVERAAALWRTLGDAARLRYEAYARAAKPLTTDRRHHHLNMIGVRRQWHGRGLARPLLEAAAQLAAADPDSAGVTLTTEHPPNLLLYEHFGYRIIGHARVAPGLETWGLFQEKPESDVRS